MPHDPELEVGGDFTVAAGIVAGHELLAHLDPPTAVFAASDEMAMGVLHVARHTGRSVPGDLSVIGIDDHEISVLLDLTTVAQPAVEQGSLAAQVLLDVIEGKPAPLCPVVLPTRLVVRGTTGPPAAGGGGGTADVG